jgi:3-hydroxyisobutyrate dehydrogenase
MARNLARAGVRLKVWNRSQAATLWFRDNGVSVADTAAQVFEDCPTIILMLANGGAVESVLERGTRQFERRVAGRTIVNMGTTSPDFSKGLEEDIISAGGRFVEAPVSGSRTPAEEGSLVAMLGGADNDALSEITRLVSPMCARVFKCGPVPLALVTKLAVNHFLITMVTGLTEAVHFAQANELDLHQFSDIIACGPMASKVSTMKLQKIIAADLSAQASLSDVLMNTELISDAARRIGIASPLLDKCLYLYREAEGLGLGGCDMIAVLGSLEAMSAINAVHARTAGAA